MVKGQTDAIIMKAQLRNYFLAGVVMSEFTKEELQVILLDMNTYINRTTILAESPSHKALRVKIESMIDNYCDHEWRCWDDAHNTRECIKCDERRTGEI